MVHTKVGEADPVNTPKGLSVTGFFFQLDGDNNNEALAPLTDALEQIVTSNSELDFGTVSFSVSLSRDSSSINMMKIMVTSMLELSRPWMYILSEITLNNC